MRSSTRLAPGAPRPQSTRLSPQATTALATTALATPTLATPLLAALLTLVLLAFTASPAQAHGTRSATVIVNEAAEGRAVVRVRTLDAEDSVTAHFDPPCRDEPSLIEGAVEPPPTPGAPSTRVRGFVCDSSIAGRALVVEGLGPIVSEAIVSVRFADGRSTSAVVRAGEPRAVLPASSSFFSVAREYVRLGVLHILAGADHLLFLGLLVLALRDTKKVLLAETAFTASHTLTFSLTALGIVRVSSGAAEACIAASLLLVALDIGRRKTPPSAREGALTALLFGLVHGLGFAGGLRELGVPEAQVGAALAGFAGGVELGQLAFIAVLLALHALEAGGSISSRGSRGGGTGGAVALLALLYRPPASSTEK
ncbi:MAG: HupE/UreJ family protein [Polyangiaceae bacterium]